MRPHVRGTQLGREWTNVEFASNRQGYRDTEWSEKKSKTRVMFLGDSYAFGWGCRFDKTMGQIVERSGKFSLYNLSIPGDGINDYYVRFNVYRREIRPDIVLILMYINDFFQEVPIPEGYLKRAVESENLSARQQYSPQCNVYPADLEDYLNKSYVYRMVHRFWFSGGFRFTSGERLRKALQMGYSKDLYFLSNDGKELRTSFSWLSENLQRMKKHSDRILVAYIPPRYAVNDELRKQLDWAFGPEAEKIQAEIVDIRLAKLCNELGVQYRSLAAGLRRAEKPVYFKFDAHLNELGHAVAAAEINEELLKLSVDTKPAR